MTVLEISDLVVAWAPGTGERVPVRRAEVIARLRAAGDARAARIVARLPVTGEFLDPCWTAGPTSRRHVTNAPTPPATGPRCWPPPSGCSPNTTRPR